MLYVFEETLARNRASPSIGFGTVGKLLQIPKCFGRYVYLNIVGLTDTCVCVCECVSICLYVQKFVCIMCRFQNAT